jgi:hypothetical protein
MTVAVVVYMISLFVLVVVGLKDRVCLVVPV